MDLSLLRNIGVAAHIDAGKTTVSECILYCSGVEHRVGLVDEGTTVLDWMSEERERGITITAAATRVPWKEVSFNLIDTPGHVDFTVEVERCMRVLDGAVLVIDAVAGVQAQSETVWRQMKRHNVPSIAFVNKCDRVGADFLAALQSLRDRLEAPAVPVQYPIYDAENLVGVVDLIERRAWRFDGDEIQGKEVRLPDGVADETDVLRSELFDLLGERDDEILAAVLEDRPVDPVVARRVLRAAVCAGELQPVLCGAALRRVGIPLLMDAISAYLPSPLDRPSVELLDEDGSVLGTRQPDPEEPLAALAFKLHAGSHGDQTFVRLYAGRIQVGQKLWNPRVRRMERPTRILRMHADSGEALEEAVAGDIVALVGLKETGTGDSLTDRAAPALLEPLVFPVPVLALMVEPASAEDRGKLGDALGHLAHEDPSLWVREDASTGQWRVEGMGELHLEVVQHRLRDEFRVEARVGPPRVSYREAVRGVGRGQAKVDRNLGGKPAFVTCQVEIRPDPDAGSPGVAWEGRHDLSEATRLLVEEALLAEGQSGPGFGYPLVEGRVVVLGLEQREGAESDQGCALAGTIALRQALAEAEVDLLEPVMRFQIESPEEFSSGILADLGARRAEVGEVRAEGSQRFITGRVALLEMFGYSTAVRSLSQGRAGFTMTPDGFAPVPPAELKVRGLVWS